MFSALGDIALRPDWAKIKKLRLKSKTIVKIIEFDFFITNLQFLLLLPKLSDSCLAKKILAGRCDFSTALPDSMLNPSFLVPNVHWICHFS